MIQQVRAPLEAHAVTTIELSEEQMQAMFGGGVPQEDMFAKLDQMREVITEVNSQFKDPVCNLHPRSTSSEPDCS